MFKENQESLLCFFCSHNLKTIRKRIGSMATKIMLIGEEKIVKIIYKST